MQQNLVNNITRIFGENNEEIEFHKLSAVCSSRQFTSTKQATWRLKIDDIETTRASPYRISYDCLNCKSGNTVSMVSFLRKLNKENPSYCGLCKNSNEEKRKQHSVWMTGKNVRDLPPSEENQVNNARDLRLKAMQQFAKLAQDDQDKYFANHLRNCELHKVMLNLESLRNGRISKDILQRCEYWEVFPSHNQMKFTSVFYDPVSNEVIRIDQPILRCETCDATWRGKGIAKYKHDKKILCHACSLCRKTFKIRSAMNIKGEKITYQSKPEKQFIEWCEEHNILVHNGPDIQYQFAEKPRIYRSDFYLPTIRYIVEIKDDHCWHKEQLKTGKWDAKMLGVQEFLQQNTLTKFVMITPKSKKNIYAEILSKYKQDIV